MPRVTMMGQGHRGITPRPQPTKVLQAIVLPGIGDVIYTWYKLINYVDMGYQIDVMCLDCEPQRSHQLMGCLRGMKSFGYVGGFEYGNYWLVNVDDLRQPPPRSLFNGVPVLHINSWPESGHSMTEFMPNIPFRYDIDITTNETAAEWASGTLRGSYNNIFLYTSSYRNNLNCNNHPDPDFWIQAALRAHEWSGSDLPPRVFMVGATYDADLTMDTYRHLREMGVMTSLVLDEDIYSVIELLRGCDLSLCYESGFAMLGDCMRVPSLWFIRCQGGNRDDHYFPYSGAVNPEGLGKWMFPFLYDQDLNDMDGMLSGTRFVDHRNEVMPS